MFTVTKTYGHNEGLSACFRQPDATSHCREPHGYALQFEYEFGSRSLNDNNWVIDFGSLKPVKAFLKATFDHRLLLAENDPAIDDFLKLYAKHGWTVPMIIPRVGCEGFAQYVAERSLDILRAAAKEGTLQGGVANKPALMRVEVREHGANSATYFPLDGRIG